MENENECEYGDREAVSVDADTSDRGFQQFITRPVILRAAATVRLAMTIATWKMRTRTSMVTSKPPPTMLAPPIAASNSS